MAKTEQKKKELKRHEKIQKKWENKTSSKEKKEEKVGNPKLFLASNPRKKAFRLNF